MKTLRVLLALASIAIAGNVEALTVPARSQTFYAGQNVDEDDMNGIETAIHAWINGQLLQNTNMVTIPNGDSLMVYGRGVFDTLRTTGIFIPQAHIRPTTDGLVRIGSGTARMDSLWVYDIDAQGTVSDSVFVRDSLNVVAGARSFLSWAAIDSITKNALFTAGATVPAGQTLTVAKGDVDTLSGGALFTGGLTVPAGQTLTVAAADIDSNKSDMVLPDSYVLTVGKVRADTASVDSLSANKTTVYGPSRLDDLQAVNASADSAFLVVGTGDTTLDAESGTKIIMGSLFDQSKCWNREAALSGLSNTSAWGRSDTSNAFPDFYAIWADSAKTSLVIWDLARQKAWARIARNTESWLYGSGVANGITFLDMNIWTASIGNGAQRIDLMRDRMDHWQTAGHYVSKGNFSQRSANIGAVLMSSSQAVVNDVVNAVAAIRDPLGATDEFGRPKQRVAVGTDGGWCVSNAGIGAFYDATATTDIVAAKMLPNGDLLGADESATRESFTWRYAVQGIAADSWAVDETWINTGSGSEDVPFADAATFDAADAIDGASVADGTSPVMFGGVSTGLMVSHSKRNSNTNGLTSILNATANWPGYSSTVIDAWALDDTTGLFGKSLTRSGTGVTFGAGVVGNGATFNGTDYLHRYGDSDLHLGTGEFSFVWWEKQADQDGATYSMELRNTDDYIKFEITALGRIYVVVSDDGGATDDNPYPAAPTGLDDGIWHQYALVRAVNNLLIYADGELVNTTALTNAAGALDPDSLGLGADCAGNSPMTGSIDHFVPIKGRALSAQEIRAMYQFGRACQQSDVDPNDALHAADVDYIQVDEQAKLVAAGDEDSVTVFSLIGSGLVPIARFGTPGGTMRDVAVMSYAGTDSFSLSLASDSAIRFTNGRMKVGGLKGGEQREIVADALRTRTIYADGDSGMTVYGGMRFKSADEDTFTDISAATPGNVGITGDLEVRSDIFGSVSALAGHMVEYVEVGANEYGRIKVSAPANVPFRLPVFVRLGATDTVTVQDNDSTRAFPVLVTERKPGKLWDRTQVKMLGFDDHEYVHFRSKRYKGDGSDSIARDTLDVYVPEVGDSVRIFAQNTLKAGFAVVTGVSDEAIDISEDAPADSFIVLTPPEIRVGYTRCLIEPGDVVHVRSSGLFGRINIDGAVGWIVPTKPGSNMSNRQMLRTTANVLPIMIAGWDWGYVDAAAAIAKGDPLIGKSLGKLVKGTWTDPNILAIALDAKASGAGLIRVRKP